MGRKSQSVTNPSGSDRNVAGRLSDSLWEPLTRSSRLSRRSRMCKMAKNVPDALEGQDVLEGVSEPDSEETPT